jgi:hypothetical protein
MTTAGARFHWGSAFDFHHGWRNPHSPIIMSAALSKAYPY